ncbi:hypothetical protein SAMN05518855_1005262 [Paenibacillus sp. CF384]|nr:hypothetical protein SAMN05518855_1005262 [Paenibacillus sp. CF384]
MQILFDNERACSSFMENDSFMQGEKETTIFMDVL